ncbi:MAG: cell wall hydrolase [Clostridia bacterium]|nr:cell wall hydrolase [Clostridia bacterium]
MNTTKAALSEQDIPMPVDEYEVLCKIVQAEAGNQDEKGKLLVANVVLNRVEHHVFPDTVTDVVFQDNGGVTQFAPTKNGAYTKSEVTIETMQAVNRALAGEDVSEGALYFKAGTENTWGNHEYLFSHGNHVFFK